MGFNELMTIPGTTAGEEFRAYVEQVRGQAFRPGEVVVMDNLRGQNVAGIAKAIKQNGVQVEYLPLYSPVLSPIESCWPKLKTALRGAKARTYEAFDTALAEACKRVTASDARGRFVHCD